VISGAEIPRTTTIALRSDTAYAIFRWDVALFPTPLLLFRMYIPVMKTLKNDETH